ncbi:MAG TPA: nuclear transport factor 2 family protein [Gemmatimonadaceae bacterium]|jgi:ketosteroid isomerase-like protein
MIGTHTARVSLRSSIAIALMTGLSACGGAPAPSPASAVVEDSATAATRTAIHAAWLRHIAGAIQRDPVAVSEIYAPNAVYSAMGVEIRGRPALDTMETRGFGAMTVLDATHTTTDLEVAGDVAYELGSIVGPVQPKGDSARVMSFHFMAQWRKQPDGNWRLTYLVGQ